VNECVLIGNSKKNAPLPSLDRRTLTVLSMPKAVAAQIAIDRHYLQRKPPMRFAFGLYDATELVGICTFGVPPSRHLQKSLCPTDPNLVVELNRLWVDDRMPRNTETFFVAQCTKLLPPLLVCSYADTAYGHIGYIYRAGNWNYAGVTDRERKTPRYDYVPLNGNHSRDAFRTGQYVKVRRQPKHKYWLATGNRRDRRDLSRICGWPSLDWKDEPIDRISGLISGPGQNSGDGE
jgi:hypothetical protein